MTDDIYNGTFAHESARFRFVSSGVGEEGNRNVGRGGDALVAMVSSMLTSSAFLLLPLSASVTSTGCSERKVGSEEDDGAAA